MAAAAVPLPVASHFARPWPRAFASVEAEPGRRARPQSSLFVSVFGAWLAALVWFHPRLAALLRHAESPASWFALAFFVAFTELAWLYAFYNLGVIGFAIAYRRGRTRRTVALPAPPPPVAILYTTCNDFVEASALSCLRQDYPDFRLYVLDDSSDPGFQRRIDTFAARHPQRVRVVRRPHRRGFKAGNINHGLRRAATAEPLFALVDADEVLPPDFLRRLVPYFFDDQRCGFVQANHRSNPRARSPLAAALGVGIDIHWRWYQPLRNRYGFVMLLGHGAVVRRRAWEEVGGFPEIVSEDLAFALRLRERGWRGRFAEDVVCLEDFPATIRAFRVRHMKWTRGTCELLAKEMGRALRCRAIPLVEKIDVLFPTLNLPLSLFYFLFVVDTNLVLALLLGEPSSLTVTLGARQLALPVVRPGAAFSGLGGVDFFLITVLTLLAPVLCFVIELAKRPLELLRFLARSTAVYGALGPLSCVGVVSYLLTGKAVFHVTGESGATGARGRLPGVRRLLEGTHPDHWAVQAAEILCALVLALISLWVFQVSFFGLSLAFLLFALMHRLGWERRLVRGLVYVPFTLMLLGLLLGGLSLAGVQTAFFGYGFHF